MSERADQARCHNSTCSPGSYFRASALKYSICLQLNPRRATTSSSAECPLRLPNVGSWARVGRTRTRSLRPAKSNKKDTGPQGKERTCCAGERVSFLNTKENNVLNQKPYQQRLARNSSVVEHHASKNTSTQMNQCYFFFDANDF